MIDLFRPLMTNAARQMADEALTPDVDGRLMIGQGPMVERFEEQFRRYVDVRGEILALNSCTSAIDLSLHLIGVGPVDDVITTPITCTASNSPIVTRLANPVWADVDRTTGLIDPSSVERLITPQTKAIVAVDWAGRRCDYAALRQVAAGIPIIQDAAHSGPTALGESHGDFVCWSFQAIKFLTTGDGGALLCPTPEITERARLLRWFGLDRRSSADFRCAQDVREVGYKYHMNDISAAIGLGNLPSARTAARSQRERAARYVEALEGHSGIRAPVIPPFDERCDYWLFTMLVEDRAGFQAHMAARGISTSMVHARNDGHTAFRSANTWTEAREDLPGVDWFDSHQVSIPVGWWLTPTDEATIIGAVLDWIRGDVS